MTGPNAEDELGLNELNEEEEHIYRKKSSWWCWRKVKQPTLNGVGDVILTLCREMGYDNSRVDSFLSQRIPQSYLIF